MRDTNRQSSINTKPTGKKQFVLFCAFDGIWNKINIRESFLYFIIDCAHIEIAESIYIASITCTDTINIHTNKYNKKQEIRDLNMDSISCELNIQTFISKLNCFLTRAQQRSHQYMKIALIP